MDFEKVKKKQNIKVLISEIVMVLTVIATVIVLVFLVSGYWLNEDMEVERQGMLQVSSIPTGADVLIDGETGWLQTTNMSKVVSAGEHTIKIEKEGYDSWFKTINVAEGLLYRIHYPRLFLTRREKENIYDMSEVTEIFLADDAKSMLLYLGDIETLDVATLANPTAEMLTQKSETNAEWLELDLTQEKVKAKSVTNEGLFNFFKLPKETKKKTDAEKLKDFGYKGEALSTEKYFFYTFYDDNYLGVLNGQNIKIYKKGGATPIVDAELEFLPVESEVGHEGEFLTFSSGQMIATLDMETLSVRTWEVEGETYDWLDTDMIYTIKGGELIVYDFDGLNRRSLATGVSEFEKVFIVDNKWLYYNSDTQLVREWLVAK